MWREDVSVGEMAGFRCLPCRSFERGVEAGLAMVMLRHILPAMDHAVLEHEMMRLPAKDRAILADALLGSLDDEAVRAVEAEWALEADRRLAAHRRGEIAAIDGATVMSELRGRCVA